MKYEYGVEEENIEKIDTVYNSNSEPHKWNYEYILIDI